MPQINKNKQWKGKRKQFGTFKKSIFGMMLIANLKDKRAASAEEARNASIANIDESGGDNQIDRGRPD